MVAALGRTGTGVDLHSDATEMGHSDHKFLVIFRGPGRSVLHGEVGRQASGAHVPDIEVPDPDFAAVLNALSDLLVQARVGAVVVDHAAHAVGLEQLKVPLVLGERQRVAGISTVVVHAHAERGRLLPFPSRPFGHEPSRPFDVVPVGPAHHES